MAIGRWVAVAPAFTPRAPHTDEPWRTAPFFPTLFFLSFFLSFLFFLSFSFWFFCAWSARACVFLGLFFFVRPVSFSFILSLFLSFFSFFFGNSEFFFFYRLRSFVFLVCSTSPCSTAFFSIAFSFVTLQTTLRVEHGLDRVLLGYFTEFFSVDGMARALEAIRRRRSNFKEKKNYRHFLKSTSSCWMMTEVPIIIFHFFSLCVSRQITERAIDPVKRV